MLASFCYRGVLTNSSLVEVLNSILASKIGGIDLTESVLHKLFLSVFAKIPEPIGDAALDILAWNERDSACAGYLMPLLNFKGFLALQTYRLSHVLWINNRKALGTYLQNVVSEKFHVYIHPLAKIGKGIMIDHATNLFIGERSVLGDDISMLHLVTVGGRNLSMPISNPVIDDVSVNSTMVSVPAKPVLLKALKKPQKRVKISTTKRCEVGLAGL